MHVCHLSCDGTPGERSSNARRCEECQCKTIELICMYYSEVGGTKTMVKMLRMCCGMYRISFEINGNQYRDSMRAQVPMKNSRVMKEPARISYRWSRLHLNFEMNMRAALWLFTELHSQIHIESTLKILLLL